MVMMPHLFTPLRCSHGGVRAAGMCLALAERYSNQMLDYKRLEQLEIQAGTAALSALSKVKLDLTWVPGPPEATAIRTSTLTVSPKRLSRPAPPLRAKALSSFDAGFDGSTSGSDD